MRLVIRWQARVYRKALPAQRKPHSLSDDDRIMPAETDDEETQARQRMSGQSDAKLKRRSGQDETGDLYFSQGQSASDDARAAVCKILRFRFYYDSIGTMILPMMQSA